MAVDPAQVCDVRRFNRVVTQRVGALYERYLGRGHSLGASRVLWELDDGGRQVRALRHDLDLDSGYLSRLLRVLEAEGLVSVGSADGDRRVRLVRLTEAGRRERALLDRRSDELAASFLHHLNDSQRTRLVTAMGEVERLLTAAMVEVAPTDPGSPAAQHCLHAYFGELDRRFEAGFDARRSIPADADELTPPAGVLLVATLRGEPVGCGALKLHGDQPAEVKRMWVDDSARGLGLGRRLLAELEEYAAEHGARTLRLETNRTLTEAVSLYRSHGYEEVEAFNDEPYADHWFEKALTGSGHSSRPAHGSRGRAAAAPTAQTRL